MAQNGTVTILVTGAAGFIGSHTVLELLNDGYSVIALDNCVNSARGKHGDKPPSLQKVEKLSEKSVQFENISTTDMDGLRTLFKKYAIDVVMHFAALKAVGESVEQPLRYFQNNVSGTVTLLQAMDEAGVKKMVFSSSATVYGVPQYVPIDENHPTGINLTNPYGKTKYFCEQILQDLATSDILWQTVSLRYFNPVGAHDSGDIGEDPIGIPNNLMPYISQVAVGRRPFLSIFGNDYNTPDGTGVRDYIHVVDLARGHSKALAWMLRNPNTGWRAFNLGTGKGVSVLEMIHAFEESCGKKIPYQVTERRKGDVALVVAACGLAERELNWRAEKNFNDMCDDSWRWQQKHKTGFAKE